MSNYWKNRSNWTIGDNMPICSLKYLLAISVQYLLCYDYYLKKMCPTCFTYMDICPIINQILDSTLIYVLWHTMVLSWKLELIIFSAGWCRCIGIKWNPAVWVIKKWADRTWKASWKKCKTLWEWRGSIAN